MKNCSYCGKENSGDASHCTGCSTQFRTDSTKSDPVTSAVSCPKCGASEYQETISLEPSLIPSFFHAGGWLASTIYAVTRKQRMRCLKCEAAFFVPTKMSRAALVFLVFILLLTAIGILIEIVE